MPLSVLYTAYAALLFLPLGLGAFLVVLVTPGVERRRRVARGTARLWLRLTFLPLAIRGLERLPEEACVVVANHASYLDGIVMTAVLPPRFGFVIKREMSRVPLAGHLLTLIGSEFVERFDRHKGGSDARRVMRNAAGGQSLVFFPEGTFGPGPGLLKFHSGAFITAARAGLPVAPCAIRGTRAALPSNSPLLQRGPICVEFLQPIHPGDADHAESAGALREHARRELLDALGEPDLSRAA